MNWCVPNFSVAAGEQPWISSPCWSALSSSSSCPPSPPAPHPCCVRSGARAKICCRPTRCFAPRQASSSFRPTLTARRLNSGWWTTSLRRWGTVTSPTWPAWSELTFLTPSHSCLYCSFLLLSRLHLGRSCQETVVLALHEKDHSNQVILNIYVTAAPHIDYIYSTVLYLLAY